MSNQGLPTGLWQGFLDFLYRTGDISIPSDFKGRCNAIYGMLDNDVSGIVSTVIDYSINAASEAKFKVECSDDTLEKLFTLWLEKINANINGVPTGLAELASEYYKERWAGSSLCLLRVDKWEKITVNNTTVSVPTMLWFVNGASVCIKRSNNKNFKIGSDQYFLDPGHTVKLPKGANETIFVQKPFGRWFTELPSPYLIKKGVYKNWKAIDVLQHKADEVISKVLPYLFLIEKGTENLFINGDVDYSDTELQKLATNFKEAMKRYESEHGKTPTAAVPFDQKYSHLIPDLRNILSEELYRQGYRAILAGLGFITIVQGIADSRKEEVVNPKPFVSEINAGVDGFKSMLMDVVRLIISKNKIEHRKLFSESKSLKISNSPLKINVQSILDQIRSAYVYGTISVKTYQEILGIDPEQELDRMRKEWDGGLRELYYPHVIQNTEKDTDIAVPPLTKKQVEKQKEKETQPEDMQEATLVKCLGCKGDVEFASESEKDTYKECPQCHKIIDIEGKVIGLKNELEIAPYNMKNIPKAIKKLPKDLQELWIRVWNESYARYKDESKAHRTAWYVVNKERDKKSKANQLDMEIKKKQNQLLDRLTHEEVKDENI